MIVKGTLGCQFMSNISVVYWSRLLFVTGAIVTLEIIRLKYEIRYVQIGRLCDTISDIII